MTEVESQLCCPVHVAQSEHPCPALAVSLHWLRLARLFSWKEWRLQVFPLVCNTLALSKTQIISPNISWELITVACAIILAKYALLCNVVLFQGSS